MAVLEKHPPNATAAPAAAVSAEAATPAREWKRQLPEPHTLPDSGNRALLQRSSLLGKLRKGEVPNPLMGTAMQLVQSSAADMDFQVAAEFLDWMVASAFVEPRCVVDTEPADGEIAVDWLSDRDRQYVLGWVQEGIRAVAPFRGKRPGAAGGGDGEGVRDAAE